MTIYIVDIEPVETRYTAQWKEHLPKQLIKKTGRKVVTISGGNVPQMTTPGAFLNFAGTNVYKSAQAIKIAEKFAQNEIEDGDDFIFTDAWNSTVIQLKYMADLLQKKINIHGLWHAGSYDPADFLGRLIEDKRWTTNIERGMFFAYDYNYFATNFHIELFIKGLFGPPHDISYHREDVMKRIVRTGWPMEYLDETLEQYKRMPKKNIILFPHRMAPEKQPEIFRDLKDNMPQYEFIIAQERQLTKNEYHNLLGEAKLVFSANLQETLGISWYEGSLVDTIPMVPDRLSYSEMVLDEFKYDSELTSSMENYNIHHKEIAAKIVDYMENYEEYLPALARQRSILAKKFFSAEGLYATINDQVLIKGA
ncbi:hypothetical protein CMI38_04700 [Candidatus Pacearchaeota archaeon]|jgi:hypothetical protein|nr:hypothetical protein [Candidatus Pacearchaeota archaeon]|tara:strand:+ start:2141 stop:3238 length:1098 start_codon:yes stop_codon:yes gene_type:complete